MFSNSWCSSCTKFAVIDIKFRFTFGKLDLCLENVKFQNVMTSIVGRYKIWILVVGIIWGLCYSYFVDIIPDLGQGS